MEVHGDLKLGSDLSLKRRCVWKVLSRGVMSYRNHMRCQRCSAAHETPRAQNTKKIQNKKGTFRAQNTRRY